MTYILNNNLTCKETEPCGALNNISKLLRLTRMKKCNSSKTEEITLKIFAQTLI